MIICKACKDPCWCRDFAGECEIEASERLEDERQSEAFYETYLDEKNQEELEERQNYLEEHDKN